MTEREFERLRWRCRRGLLELDIVLYDFLDRNYSRLTVEERVAFGQLLTVPDPLLHQYLFGTDVPDDPEINKLVRKIRQ